eukprot:CAMPEP_0197437546 /NCGR_PEP_ID=MMETSP1175-20131217/4765_1 /TAXON_ID=1003142 /ORGANISM="Triceratium dubium, Strain CCMP147" /LENGTH=826 /DNA_ID=CAMNT_0042967097 /DNA_START=238 /DNA_END=2718 /DNA_ORIENTATION=+
MPTSSPNRTIVDQPQLTRVNGIGLWNSWTRNFKTPLLALLDLLDNSVDAAFEKDPPEPEGTTPGSLGAESSAGPSPDVSSSCSQPPVARRFHGKIHIDADTWNNKTTGLKIVNNSSTAIKDLGKIMEVYSSSKGRVEHGQEHSQEEDLAANFAHTIGENGVGLKQGCATLSDLSFVLTRASNGQVGMAVIAQRLQSEAGVYLPHIYFHSTEMQLLRNEMRKIFSSQQYSNVGQCVADYGNGNLLDGIDRVLQHFHRLNKKGTGEWGEEDHVFCVVLHQLKHGNKVTATNEEHHGAAKEKQYEDNANFLMQELLDQLPRNYIHINMEVRVAGTNVHFHYWQRRLAEITLFYLNIDETNSYMGAPDWEQPAQSYPLRVFCGFDSVRLTSDDCVGSCSVSIYSRFTGRLIKHEEDARALLKLPSGGTDYSQGLTIIVDDMLGNLPLNPTKQDVAFGEQAHGDVHKRNIFAWLSAIARLYYKHHLDTHCSGKKGNLTAKVRRFGTPVVDPTRLKLLDQSYFNEFRDPGWKLMAGTIVPKNRKSMEIVMGPDTLRTFTSDAPAPAPARKKATAKRKRVSQELSGMEEEVTSSPIPSRRRRAKVNYKEKDLGWLEADAEELDDDADDAMPVVDLGVPRTSVETEAQKVSPVSQEEQLCSGSSHGENSVKQEEGPAVQHVRSLQAQIKGQQEQIETLRDSVKRHKDKSHERKKLVRQIDAVNKQLKKKIATLEGQDSAAGSPKSKSAHELQLEEQVDQLMNALVQEQQKKRESDDEKKELEEKVAALTQERDILKRNFDIRQEENVTLTSALEEVTSQLQNVQGQQQNGMMFS